MSLLKGIRLQGISLMLILHPIMKSLLADVDSYGLGIFRDGATIVKNSLMNILASSPNNPSCVLDVIDCSKHMLRGGKKDAWFISKNI
jgi:hypothetical protein